MLKSFSIALALLLTASIPSISQSCLYGLGTYNMASEGCHALEREALQRVVSAKTICYSANSQVSWSKNNKEPTGAFTIMRAGSRIAMKGFTFLYSCERADLVVRIDYEFPESATLTVTDAESGKAVFREQRSVSDLSSDLTRMATHFQSMRADAIADQAATAAAADARAKEEAFLASLPKHWKLVRECNPPVQCSDGPFVEIWISDDVLHESSIGTFEGQDSIKRETTCSVKRGVDEFSPWVGECTYNFTWPNWSRPTCTVQTKETITTIGSKEIAGRSQKINYTPLSQTPTKCPVPADEDADFRMTPAQLEATH